MEKKVIYINNRYRYWHKPLSLFQSLMHEVLLEPLILNFMYLANAWEEDEEVVLITCRTENLDLEIFNGPLKEKTENFSMEL